MNGQISGDQIGGIVRAAVPMILTALVSIGLLDKSTMEVLREPAVAVAVSVATLSVAISAAWSVWVNRPAEIVKSAAALTPDIKVVVGPLAPPAIKDVAADPSITNVITG